MKREKVNSTTLISVGYDKPKQVLEAEFTTGHIYRYFSVPYNRYKELLKAESIGAYFNHYIKKFPFLKVK